MRTLTTVTEVVEETPSTVTLRFDYPPAARPGQFVMVWFPGDDELPMSLSYTDPKDSKGVTIKAMGETTRRVLSIRPGTQIGVRGPYGNTFDLSPKRILIVAGGSGAAVLAPAGEAARALGSEVFVALGAVTAKELLFEKRFESMAPGRVRLSTDDGTAGTRGYVTGVVEELLASQHFDALWTCGPEVMMVKLVDAASKAGVPAYCSMEREMKCAIALCDACALGPYHVCTDGPVFSAATLKGVPDFGRFQRDPSGRRVRPGLPVAPSKPGSLYAPVASPGP